MTDDLRGGQARPVADLSHAPGPVVPAPEGLEPDHREGITATSRTQWQLFRRKFLRHKLAMTSLTLLIIISLAGLFAESISPYAYDEIDLTNRGVAPTFTDQHFFGTDRIGRDYFSRVLFGTGTSVRVAFLVATISTVTGTAVGAVAGYYRGWADNVLMRLTDFILTVPLLAVLLILAAFLGRGSPWRVGVILGLLLWTYISRIVRGQYLSLREKEFVEAARASGASDLRIMFRHMLPNTLSPIIVNATLTVALAILYEATLSFLGFGIQPPTPALGKLISDGQNAMLTQWWLVTMPGLMIVTICLCINFIGDGLRDALDPTQQER